MMIRKSILACCLAVVALQTSAFEAELYAAVEAEQWKKAHRVLRRADRACDKVETEQACKLKVTFSRGWALSQQSLGLEEKAQKRLLTRAKADYQSVLSARPGHQATLSNLLAVLTRLGDIEGMKLLAIQVNNDRQASVYARAGDLALEQESWQSAFDLFQRSFALEATEVSAQGLIRAYARTPSNSNAEVLYTASQHAELSKATKRRFNQAIIASSQSVNGSLWERVLLRWVTDMGRNRQLSATVLKNTFDVERNEILSELANRLSSPTLASPIEPVLSSDLLLSSPGDAWWGSTLARRQALAMAAWSTGHHRLIENDPDFADRIWIAALAYSPKPGDYKQRLKGESAVYLDVLADLARLFQQYRATLDPNGYRFKAVENVLFVGKSGAYRTNDLESIQRHHTLLGKIYADLGIFTRGKRGAKFQLSRAIAMAERRSTQTGVSDPQPVLQKLLGDGYNCVYTSSTNCQKQPDNAATAYTEAAEAYLALDDLDAASSAIENAKKTNATLSARAVDLESIIKVRRDLFIPINSNEAQWLYDGSNVDSEFADQQRFRLYADKAVRTDDPGAAKKALEIISEQTVRAAEDVVRVNKLKDKSASLKIAPDQFDRILRAK